MAEIATIRRNQRFVHIQRRVKVGKLGSVGIGVQPARRDTWLKDFCDIDLTPAATNCYPTLPRIYFFINW